MQRAGIATYSLLCVVRLLCARSTYSIYFKAKFIVLYFGDQFFRKTFHTLG
jgi:hypothetical protein